MGTCSLSRMVAVYLLLGFLLCTVVQQSPLSPAKKGSPSNKGVYVVIGPLNMKSLMPKSSPKKAQDEAQDEGDDYALTFGGKTSNIQLLMGEGADVAFNGDVDNIAVEYTTG